jgi:endonuclease/exonuclease/phosphatase (EEP) superfamily protein YafD
MRFVLAHLTRTAQTLCWLLAFATVCAYLARLWWGFELFVHFRMQYAISGLVLAAGLWAVRRRRMSALAALLAIANGIPIVPLLFAHAEAAHSTAGPTLRVLSINVFGRNHDYARVFDYVRAERPDVVVLLEIDPAWARALEQLHPEFVYSWVRPTGPRAGMAVLCREQPREAREVDLGGTGERSLVLTLENSGAPVAVLGTHLYWPLGPHTSTVRNRQLAAIGRLARAPGPPLAVVGDFNVTPFSPYFARLLREDGLRNCANGRALAPTWPARVPLFYIRIDHCLATDGLSATNMRVGPYVGSDHYPIAVDLRSVAPAR